jgi:hypothetical protein
MKPNHLNALVLCCGVVIAAGCAAPAPGPVRETSGRTLRPFRDDADLMRFTRALRLEVPRPAPPSTVMFGDVSSSAMGAPGAAEPASESITNVQHQGVDEGDIVKVHGDYLVMLRRGRLFTVRIGGDALEPVSAADAFGPGIDPSGTWIDEMLVADDQVVVIGYSYARGGTEVGLFRLDSAGRLTYRATYQLRSGDYYSARNYASRLVGGKLVLYSPVPLDLQGRDPFAGFPAVRRWGAGDTTFHRTAAATRVYRPAGAVSPTDGSVMLHTVTVCELGGEEMDCRATALFGPEGRVFYVSAKAVYVWTMQGPAWNGERRAAPSRAMLYRMPLDGSAPTALRVSGGPVDQLSFLESGGFLNVLVQGGAGGEAMWTQETSDGPLSLLRVRLAAFGDGSRAAPVSSYRPLPTPQGFGLQNRYVGGWLLYGMGEGWSPTRRETASVYAVRWAGGAVTELPLPHRVDRIEAMGAGAVVVGGDGRDLHFSGVRLGAAATLAGRYTRPDASQGETRTHGFFYRPDGNEAGVVGLPIRGAGQTGERQLTEGSASVLFLRNQAFRLRELGALAGGDPGAADDACRVSCVDWYGNARPIFLRGRIFALMGYELVEGREDDGRIHELRRVSFAPTPAVLAGR